MAAPRLNWNHFGRLTTLREVFVAGPNKQARVKAATVVKKEFWNDIANIVADEGHQVDVLDPSVFFPVGRRKLEATLLDSADASLITGGRAVGMEQVCFSTRPGAKTGLRTKIAKAGSLYHRLLQHWDYNPPLRFRLENLDRLLGTRNADFAAAWLWEFADSGADTFDGCNEADDAHEPQNNKLPSGAVLDPNTVQALRQARQIREHSMEVAQGPF